MKTMRRLLVVGAAGLGLIVAACGNDDGRLNNTNNTNNSGCAVEANFTSIHDNILAKQPGCASAGCHDSVSSSGNLNFTAGKADVYRQLTEEPVLSRGTTLTKRVDTTPETSFLYERLSNPSNPMPPFGGLIPDCEQKAVDEWITGGAPND